VAFDTSKIQELIFQRILNQPQRPGSGPSQPPGVFGDVLEQNPRNPVLLPGSGQLPGPPQPTQRPPGIEGGISGLLEALGPIGAILASVLGDKRTGGEFPEDPAEDFPRTRGRIVDPVTQAGVSPPRGSNVPFIFTGGSPFPPNKNAQLTRVLEALLTNIQGRGGRKTPAGGP